jgi:hypothetical protein
VVRIWVSVRCREFIIMINSKCAANLSFIDPERGGFGGILPEVSSSLRVIFRRIPRAEGRQMTYYTES